MGTRQSAPKKALSGTSGAAVLLLAAWCAPTLASTTVDADCPEAGNQPGLVVAETELPTLDVQSGSIDLAGYDADSMPAFEDEIVNATSLRPAATLSDQDDVVDESVEDGDSASEVAPAATRLHGVSETDLPRFRRRMNRTDI